MGKDTLRIISPNGHLGFAPQRKEVFTLVQKQNQIITAVIQAVTISARCLWAWTNASAIRTGSITTWN